MWYLRTMEDHSALKRKGILTHYTALINLEDIILSEINKPVQKRVNPVFSHLYDVLRIVKFIKTAEWWL